MTAEEQRNPPEEAQASKESQRSETQDFQQAIQQNVSRAIEPLVSNLQGQISQIVREQMVSGVSTSDEQNQSGGTQEPFQQAAEALNETFVLLGKTIRAILETVRAVLKTVGQLLRALLTALTQGLQTIRGAVEDAIQSRIIQAIVDRVKAWFGALIDRIVSWAMPGGHTEGASENR